MDLRKAEADPHWPKILAQATFARPRPQACDTVLAAMTAWPRRSRSRTLDGPGAVPVIADGTLGLVLPDGSGAAGPGGRTRRRTAARSSR